MKESIRQLQEREFLVIGADLAGSINHCPFCSSLLQNDLTLLKAVAKLSLTSLEGGLLETATLDV